ncbi:MAG: hypothetical protein V4633_01485 [Pseudomonadota bacterium]
MRPPDENQDGTKNILARLERQGPQHASKSSGAGIRLALVGGSGLLVVGLIGLLVSLGQENLASPPLADLAQVDEFVEPPRPRRKVPDIVPLDPRDVATVDTSKKAAAPALVTLPRMPAAAPEKKKSAKPAARPAPKTAARPAPAPAPARKVRIAAAPPPPLPLRIEPRPVDTDIALLTAILSMSPRHHGEVLEQEAAACAVAVAQSRKCLDKGVSRP